MSSMCWAHLGNCAHWNLELFGIARSAIFAGVLSEAEALGRGSKFKAKKRTRNRLSIDRLVFGNGILGTPLLTKTHYRIRSNRARIRTLEWRLKWVVGNLSVAEHRSKRSAHRCTTIALSPIPRPSFGHFILVRMRADHESWLQLSTPMRWRRRA
jgi:hypothetical protein